MIDLAIGQIYGKSRDSIEFALITQALQRSSMNKWITSTSFIQKPPIMTDETIQEDDRSLVQYETSF